MGWLAGTPSAVHGVRDGLDQLRAWAGRVNDGITDCQWRGGGLLAALDLPSRKIFHQSLTLRPIPQDYDPLFAGHE
jgi:hypothetical protein